MQSPIDLKAQDYKDVIFSGVVVNNNSLGKDGKVQIRVPHIFDGIQDSDLPWAIADRMNSPAGTGVAGSATCMVPANGSKVFVAFQMGNPYNPIYSSDILNTQFFASTVFGGEYPNAWGFSDGSNFIKINRVTGAVTVQNAAGSYYKIEGDGAIKVATASGSSYAIDAAGAVTVNSNNQSMTFT